MWKEEDGPAWTGWSPMKVGASVLACPRHVTAGVASPGIALGPAHGSRCPVMVSQGLGPRSAGQPNAVMLSPVWNSTYAPGERMMPSPLRKRYLTE